MVSVQSFQRLVNVPKCNVHSRAFVQRLMKISNSTLIRVHYFNVVSTYLMQRSLTYNIPTLNQRIKCNVVSRTIRSTFKQRTQIQRSFTCICSTFNERMQCNVDSRTLFQRWFNVSNATFINVQFPTLIQRIKCNVG